MPSISVKELLLWKKQQLSKGGEIQSLALLLDTLGGISKSDFNLLRINPKHSFYLKKNLAYLETVWENHLETSMPIQYLCGFLFERLKVKSY